MESSEVERLLGRQVDGLLLASAQPPASADIFERIEARGVPYVLIDRRFAGAPRPMSARTMRRSAAGHAPPDRARLPPDRAHRRAATHSGDGAAEGLPGGAGCRRPSVPGIYIVHATDDDSAYLAARRLLALKPRPDGIFGYNDPTAAGAMKAILEAGIAHSRRDQSDRRGQRPLLRPAACAAFHHRSKQRRASASRPRTC